MKFAQSCLTLQPHGLCIVHGILQARILEQVAFPFSRGSSQPRDRSQVSCTACGFFTSWTTREAHPTRRQHHKRYRSRLLYNLLSSLENFKIFFANVYAIYLICSELMGVLHKMQWNPKWLCVPIIIIIKSGLISFILRRNTYAVRCGITHTHTHTHTLRGSFMIQNKLKTLREEQRPKPSFKPGNFPHDCSLCVWIWWNRFCAQVKTHRCWGCLSWRCRAWALNCVGVKLGAEKVMRSRCSPGRQGENVILSFLWYLLTSD